MLVLHTMYLFKNYIANCDNHVINYFKLVIFPMENKFT